MWMTTLQNSGDCTGPWILTETRNTPAIVEKSAVAKGEDYQTGYHFLNKNKNLTENSWEGVKNFNRLARWRCPPD